MTHSPSRQNHALTKVLVSITVALWAAVSVAAINAGFYQPAPGDLPLNFIIGAGGPVFVFLGLYAASTAFRDFILGLDLRLLTMVQAWRVIGFAMLALFAYDRLPGVFAWPAGLGDVAIGLAAPFYALALMDRPETASSRSFATWQWLGIFDFAVAFFLGIVASGALPAVTGGGVTTAAMGAFPMALLPGFFVPLFFMVHLASLLQIGRLRGRVAVAA